MVLPSLYEVASLCRICPREKCLYCLHLYGEMIGCFACQGIMTFLFVLTPSVCRAVSVVRSCECVPSPGLQCHGTGLPTTTVPRGVAEFPTN